MFNMRVSPDRGALRIVRSVAVRCGGRCLRTDDVHNEADGEVVQT
ncbi:hypothetical protein ACVIW0_007022 [Bradyrhizobium sp. USDA 4454]